MMLLQLSTLILALSTFSCIAYEARLTINKITNKQSLKELVSVDLMTVLENKTSAVVKTETFSESEDWKPINVFEKTKENSLKILVNNIGTNLEVEKAENPEETVSVKTGKFDVQECNKGILPHLSIEKTQEETSEVKLFLRVFCTQEFAGKIKGQKLVSIPHDSEEFSFTLGPSVEITNNEEEGTTGSLTRKLSSKESVIEFLKKKAPNMKKAPKI